MIKLVKFLLLIVLIASTYTWVDQTACADQIQPNRNIVVLKMPENDSKNDSKNYDAFPGGYLFFTSTETGLEDKFSLGINALWGCGTVPELKIEEIGPDRYKWSWQDTTCEYTEDYVENCEVYDWDWQNSNSCNLFFDSYGALNYPFAWESKHRLRPTRYYVEKNGVQINIFELVIDAGSYTFYAFANDQPDWELLFECNNPKNDECTYILHAADWDPWPSYEEFVIKSNDNKTLVEEEEYTWDIGKGFKFYEAFKNCNDGYYLSSNDGEYLPSKVGITTTDEDGIGWKLETTIPAGGVLYIVPPDSDKFIGYLKIDDGATEQPCPEGSYCNNCGITKCPDAFTSAVGEASEAKDCYIDPDIKFTYSSGTGGKTDTVEFGLPVCDSYGSGSGCVKGRIKVNYNPDLKLQ